MTDKIIKVVAAGFYCFMYVWYSRKAIKAVEAILTTQYFRGAFLRHEIFNYIVGIIFI